MRRGSGGAHGCWPTTPREKQVELDADFPYWLLQRFSKR